MNKYAIVSSAVAKLVSKKYGIHTPIRNTLDTGQLLTNKTEFPEKTLDNNANKHFSIGCLRCVGEWVSAATELVNASISSGLGQSNVWESDLGIELARALIARRLTINLSDFYEIIKFFALIKNDKLEIISQLLDVQLQSLINTSDELQQIGPRKLLQIPLLLHLSNSKVDKKTIEFITCIFKYIKEMIDIETPNNVTELKLQDIVSAQIGLSNLGFRDLKVMKSLNQQILNYIHNDVVNPYNLQLYNISFLANSSCYVDDFKFYEQVRKIDNNLHALPPSHIATYSLVKAIVHNIYDLDNCELFKVIADVYSRMLLEDKIIAAWSMISLGIDKISDFTALFNDIFGQIINANISTITRIMVDQICITLKLCGFLVEHNIQTPIPAINNHICDNDAHTDTLLHTIKRILYNLNLSIDNEDDSSTFNSTKQVFMIADFPYYHFNLTIPIKHDDKYSIKLKGIGITIYKSIDNVANPLLWDPYYTIRKIHLEMIGWKDIYLPDNWSNLSHKQITSLFELNN